MLQGAADEGAQPYGIWCYLCHPACTAIGHLHVQGNEIEPVIILPLVEVGVDVYGVLVKEFGVEQLPGGRAQCVLLEEIVLVHDTDFF